MDIPLRLFGCALETVQLKTLKIFLELIERPLKNSIKMRRLLS